MNVLGKRIKTLREAERLNQVELASILNISNTTLSQYESGRRIPSDDIKIRIADYFNVTTDYLLGVTEGSNKNSTNIYEVPEMFDDPGEAREYIDKHQMFGSSGLDTSKLDDEEIVRFANELLEQMKMVSYKYRK